MAGKDSFEHLLSPGKIGNVELKNRFWRSGAGMLFCKNDGFVTDEARAYYTALAKGGTGAICVGPASGCKGPGVFDFENYQFWDDEFIPGMKDLADIIHSEGDGAKCFMQSLHAGPMHQMFMDLSDSYPIAASTLPEGEIPSMVETSYYPPLPYLPYHAMTREEIKDTIEEWIQAAERAQKAGFDGVEINGAAVHLLNTFFSCAWNRRHDEYGCDSLENRSRFAREIISGVKERCGDDFAVISRFNISEFGHPLGITIEEAKGFAKLIEGAGADAIHGLVISYGQQAEAWQWQDCAYYPEAPDKNTRAQGIDWSNVGKGAMLPLVEQIKAVVSIPIVAINRMDHIVGEKALREGKCDFVGMQRRLIADPALPKKVAEGRLEDIAPCTACTTCISVHGPVSCRVSGAMGLTDPFEVQPAKIKKKVTVVGGGPAGMEAARVAALRGHDVTIYEEEKKLGGSLPLAATVKGTEIENIPDLVSYLVGQIKKLGVKVKNNTAYTASMAKNDDADVVIAAVGGVDTQPSIPGLDNKIVVSNEKLHKLLKTALKYFNPEFLTAGSKVWMPIGKKVVIIGGTMSGLELAEFLVKNGRSVTVLGEGDLGTDMPMMKIGKLFQWLGNHGVELYGNAKIKEITQDGVKLTTEDGKDIFIEADSVITSLPLSENKGLVDDIRETGKEVYAVGDCNAPGTIATSIGSAYRLAKVI
jgi:2,4-dienoyl-CoA reductase (NADPH2)